MIIGIFGQRGHGKSTFARVLQIEIEKYNYQTFIVNKPSNEDYLGNNNQFIIVEHGEWLTEATNIKRSGGYNIFVWNDQEVPPNLNDNAGLVIQWLEERDSSKKEKYVEMFDKYFNYLVKRDNQKIMSIHAATIALHIHHLTILPKKKSMFD